MAIQCQHCKYFRPPTENEPRINLRLYGQAGTCTHPTNVARSATATAALAGCDLAEKPNPPPTQEKRIPYKIACRLCKHWRRFQPGDDRYDPDRTHLGACTNELYEYNVTGELAACGEFEPAVEPICQTCAFWEHLEDAESPNAGTCHNLHLAYGFPADEHGKEQLPSDGLMFVDNEEECAYLWTGPNFGCIHHQPRT